MDIAAMLLWMFTVAAGVYLLAARRPARGSEDPAGASAPAAAPAPATASPAAGSAPDMASPGTATAPAATPAHAAAYARVTAGVPPAAAAAYAAGAKVPPITHTRITTRPGEHPLLEFMHPALGVVGLGCWMAFVITRFSTFAWVALGVIVVTIAAGVSWYTVNARAARVAQVAQIAGSGTSIGSGSGTGSGTGIGSGIGSGSGSGTGSGSPAGRYPARRLLIHGSGAAVTFILAIVTALITHHA